MKACVISHDSLLLVLNVLIFAYQTMNTVGLIRRQNPQYWPGSALSIVSDTLLGSTNVRGPLTTDFVHFQPYSQLQPHRFLTARFLHGDILHLLLNLDALRRLPTWLVETGLGTKMFITTIQINFPNHLVLFWLLLWEVMSVSFARLY